MALGNWDGAFQNAVDYNAGNGSACVTPGDLNNDGTLDIAIAYDGGTTVSVLLETLAPIVTLSGTSLVFGNQNVGTSSSPETVTLVNTGNAPLTRGC